MSVSWYRLENITTRMNVLIEILQEHEKDDGHILLTYILLYYISWCVLHARISFWCV